MCHSPSLVPGERKRSRSVTPKPLVSILMPVRDGARYVQAAIDSILAQTMHDFELIALDDGSTDETPDILAACDDSRLVVVTQEPRGLVETLNGGLEIARGTYVARMDADDVAVSRRLELQLAFMESHPDVGIVGSSVRLIDEAGTVHGARPCATDEVEIRWESLLENPFMHSTVMLRSEVLQRHSLTYDDDFRAVEDYDLWMRLLRHAKGANLAEPLVLYRFHEANVGKTAKSIQMANLDRVALRTIREVLPDFDISEQQVTELRLMMTSDTTRSPELNWRRAQLTELYLDMFDEFRRVRAGGATLQHMPFRGAVKAARGLRHGFGERGWLGAAARLLRANPGLPWQTLLRVVSGETRRP